jgi:hypothetical protein
MLLLETFGGHVYNKMPRPSLFISKPGHKFANPKKKVD